MKSNLKVFIILIAFFLLITKANSVYDSNFNYTPENKIFFYKKFKNNICENQWKYIGEKIKYKHLQKKALSCEISASADILSYLTWKKITEDILLKKLSKSQYKQLPQKDKNMKLWWNPEEWFVWYIDKLPNWNIARQRKMTGYWVLEKPIVKIFNSYGFKTQIINKYNYSKNFNQRDHLILILNEFKKGNMIQFWWDICTNPKYYSWKEHKCFHNWKLSWNQNRKISWNYIDEKGNIVKYIWLNWEHAFYLLWYKWDINNPTDIIVRDTYTGLHTYPTNEWMRKWSKMQYRSIIIYAK